MRMAKAKKFASAIDAVTLKHSGVESRDQTHRKFVYRPLQFHKRSQHFISADDETFSVAMRVNKAEHAKALSVLGSECTLTLATCDTSSTNTS